MELEDLLSLTDEQLRLAADRLKLERDQRLNEKGLHLAALRALAEHETKRRPGWLKALLFIPTFGQFKDKKNERLEEQIEMLELEIKNWK